MTNKKTLFLFVHTIHLEFIIFRCISILSVAYQTESKVTYILICKYVRIYSIKLHEKLFFGEYQVLCNVMNMFNFYRNKKPLFFCCVHVLY